MFTGENMVGMNHTQATQGVWSYTQSSVYDFAVANNLDQHNATHLVVHNDSVAWYDAITTASTLRAVLNTHVPLVMARFPLVKSWNVVNEAIYSEDAQPGGWRDCNLYQAFGANWPSEWFKLARTVAPTAELCWTDFTAIERTSSSGFTDTKAALIWALNDGAPINTFGMQMHMANASNNTSPAEMVDRLGQIAALGLDIRITEPDLYDRDSTWPLATRRRDQVAYHEARLGAILAQVPAVKSYNMWTIGDAESWLNFPQFGGNRTDGLSGEFSAIGRDGIVKPEWWAMFERVTRP